MFGTRRHGCGKKSFAISIDLRKIIPPNNSDWNEIHRLIN